MKYLIYYKSVNDDKFSGGLSFGNLEEAVTEFNRIALVNRSNNDVTVCLTAAIDDKVTNVKKKTYTKQKKKKKDNTKMFYKVMFPNILDTEKPKYICIYFDDLDRAACFFDNLTNAYNILTDDLVALFNVSDDECPKFKCDDSDSSIFKEQDRVYKKIKKNNKNSNHTKKSKQCLNENKATVHQTTSSEVTNEKI